MLTRRFSSIGVVMDLGMKNATRRWLACALAVFAVTTTIWFAAKMSQTCDYPQCDLLGNCTGTTPDCYSATEDINLWGMVQKLRWERIGTFTFLFVMSLSCFALMVDRWLRYAVAAKQSKEFQSRIGGAIHENRVEETPGIAAMYPASPVAAVVCASLANQPRFSD